MSDNILQEVNQFNYSYEELNEDGKTKSFKLKGTFQFANKANGNGRVYPGPVLEGALSEVKTIVEEGRMLGELDHPTDAKIHLDKVSHKITKLEMRPTGEMYGEATVLPTPAGKILESLLRSGVKLGVSSRGFGSTKEANGLQEVQSDYKLVTFDIVSDPSTPGAFPQPVYEAKESKEAMKTETEEKKEEVVSEKFVSNLGYTLEEILEEKVTIEKEKRVFVGLDEENNRYYMVEGGKDSYGTLNFHMSHDYHILLKNGEKEERISINEDNIDFIRRIYGKTIHNKLVKKIDELGYSPRTLNFKKEEI
jgi:hypothetical protein